MKIKASFKWEVMTQTDDVIMLDTWLSFPAILKKVHTIIVGWMLHSETTSLHARQVEDPLGAWKIKNMNFQHSIRQCVCIII